MKGLLLAIVALLPPVQTPHPEASKPAEIGEQHYRIYRGDGTPATLDEVLAASKAATVTFLGEPHDDPVAHYLEEQILRLTWIADSLCLWKCSNAMCSMWSTSIWRDSSAKRI